VLFSWRRGFGDWQNALPWQPLQIADAATAPKKRKWFGR